MTKYFNQFPKIDYNISGVNGNTKVVTDIFRRVYKVTFRDKLSQKSDIYFIRFPFVTLVGIT